MRVLLTAAPGTGHVVPLLGIGRALREAGHQVCLATDADSHHLAQRVGLEVAAVGMSEPEMIAERVRRWPQTQQEPPERWAVRMFTQILAPATLRGLGRVVDSWRPQLLIHEEGDYAGPVAAASTGVPWVTHGWGSPLRTDEDLRSLETDAAALWREAGVAMPPAAGLYHDGLLDPCPPALQAGAAGAHTIWPIRPMPFDDGKSAIAQDTSARDRAYVGFGTVAAFKALPSEIDAAVSALVGSGLSPVLTIDDDDLAERTRASHPGVDVQRFVSLPDLLPSCRIVVCHAGSGTVLAALSAGAPVVLLPRGTPSQLRIARACEQAGVGAIATPDSLADTIRSVVADEAMAQSASAVAFEIATMPPPGAVVPHLEHLVRP
jgi:UDP:flavonoid glycosyltransferase YjiC (YdhE family)